jgi:Leucine-rich repeat (LRR) protein
MSTWETLIEQKDIGKQLDLSVGSKEKKMTTTSLAKVVTFKSLTSLSLSGHSLKDLPDDFAQLTELEKLDLSKNEFKSLGPVGNLCKLKELSLKLNQFSTFPSGLLKFQNLEKVDLSFNNIKQVKFEADIVTQILAPKKPNQLPPVKFVNMSYNELTKFPTKLLDFKGLTHLELSRNHFGDDIPPSIAKFQDCLKVLILDEIGMTRFPMEVIHLMFLEKLSISKNSIRELPTVEKMLNLSSLKELYMNSCELLRWSSLTILCKLQVLHLNDNSIASVPYEAKHLLSLRELKISKNQIQDIPSHIQFLSNLETVDFTYNKIDCIWNPCKPQDCQLG